MLPAVLWTPLPPHQPLGFETVQQTRHAGRLLDHPLPHLQGWQPIVAAASEDPENIELLKRDAVRLDHRRRPPPEQIRRPQQRDHAFLGGVLERAALPEFTLQGRYALHKEYITSE
jgi:hypothetical protein